LINVSIRKILLTGGLGYIGSHVAAALVASGYEVVLYDNLSNSKLSVVNSLERVFGKTVTFIEGDVRDERNLFNVLSRYEISAVIHCAGLKAVGDSVLNPIEYYDNNVSGSISLIKAMASANVKSLVYHWMKIILKNLRILMAVVS
jgi:UDP-glucose 4-epimerase